MLERKSEPGTMDRGEESLGNSDRKKMVGWYDPRQLIRTGIDVFVSEILKDRADTRILEALTEGNPFEDRSDEPVGENGFWFDYMADTGDGWKPTYAMARLLARRGLAMEGGEQWLSRGRLLILGGDEVYPVASRDNYESRLIGPFKQASQDVAGEGESDTEGGQDPPEVFAIPGNHDWYDGLASFMRLFTNPRKIGLWRTGQKRSYFAIKLPLGWWIWGIDTQLQGDVDRPQMEFFGQMMEKLQPGDRIIVCTPTPDWIHEEKSRDPDLPGHLHLARTGLDDRKATVPLQLSGDIHNYQHFQGGKDGTWAKIVSGGGGAFLHPTHRIGPRKKPSSSYERVKEYPSPKISAWLSFRLPFFLFFNRWLWLLTVPFYLSFSWPMLRSATSLDFLLQGALAVGLAILLLVICIFYADKAKRFRWWGGLSHGLVQVASAYYACRSIVDWRGAPGNVWPDLLVTLGCIATAGYFIMPTVLGLYLFLSLNLFGVHHNEAFSALRLDRYKNFLRLCIRPTGELWVHPIGLDTPGGEHHLIEPPFPVR
jgi:predicted MPP superfamily phosphohydrolase